MISPDVFHRLRAAQLRSAHEQQLLSGREWILIVAFVQALSALHPLFAWINRALLGDGTHGGLHPSINFAASLGLAIALATLAWWARFAPFRAAVVAVIVYLVVQGALGFVDPRSLLSGAIVKSLVLVGLLQAARTAFLRHRAQ